MDFNLPYLFLYLISSVNFYGFELSSAAELPFVVDANTKPLRVRVNLNEGQLQRNLGRSLQQSRTIASCKNQDGDCWEWSDGSRLDIQNDPRNILCKTVVWTSPDPAATLQDCWKLSDYPIWYGGGSQADQKWPIPMEPLTDDPQVTGGGATQGSWNNIHNPGVAIKVDDHVPLFVTIDPKDLLLCFKAANMAPYRYNKYVPPVLSYNVCYGKNLTELYLGVVSRFFKLPSDIPDPRIFRSPVWNTWPKFRKGLNENTLKDYIYNISKAVGIASGILVIGRGWEPCDGDHQFNSINFPDPKRFFRGLLRQNAMEAYLWVHPKINTKCYSYEVGYKHGFFVTDRQGDVLVTEWNDKNVSFVDFTQPDAVEWWTKKLLNLQEKYGVTSFFFDHGQTSFLPSNYHFSVSDDQQPDVYSTKYVDMAAAFGNSGFVNVGRNSQQHPLFVRMPEKQSTYEGLQSVIPSVLQMGINGFPFVLPAVIGGSSSGNALPDRGLYIRWLELSTLLPIMHFSLGPWEYDGEVINIASKMADIRGNHVATIVRTAEESCSTGVPLVRPLWWICPNDTNATVIWDQFLVGDTLMVAPIVDEREVRDVYVPAGNWKSSITKEIISGPKLLKKISVKLDELAFFERVAS